MIYNLDNDPYYMEEFDGGFLQPYDDQPSKRRKANDDFVLQRYSLVESTEQRKQRLNAKREERKLKLDRKEVEKSTTATENASSQEVCKEDSRKIRNRNSAQLSRDRKRAQQQQLVEDNERMRQELETRNSEMQQYIQEIDMLNQQLRLLQDLRTDGQLKCPYCQQQVIPQEVPTYIRAQNSYSSRSLKTYGLLSLFVIVTMLGCLSNTPGNEVAPMQLFQIRQKEEKMSADEHEPLSMEVTSLDQMRQLRNFKFDGTEDPAVFNLHVNLRTMEPQQQQLPGPDKTLFLNCTASSDKCDALVRIMASRNVRDVHQLGCQKGTMGGGFKHYSNGQEITILQVFEQGEQFVMNTVKCMVEQTSNLLLDNELIEKLTI